MNENDNSKKYSKSQQDALEASKDIFKTLISAAKEKRTLKISKTEDDDYKTFNQKVCPYNVCDGSGYIKKKDESGSFYSVDCQCYKDEVMKRKLKKAEIQTSFWDASTDKLNDINDKIDITFLKPRPIQLERKIDGRKKTIPPETPNEFIERTYETQGYKGGLKHFADHFIKSTFEMLSQKPRTNTINLLLLGDPGKGKTFFASAIAKEFLLANKTVHFTRMRSLLDKAFDQKDEVMKMVKTVDLLILDELGQEYHTDSKWALKQIQDIIKERQETCLPTICTTNSYPNELEQYYESSLMSTFNGKFFICTFTGEYDLRALSARNMYDSSDFFNGLN